MKTSTKLLVTIMLTTAWSFIGQAQTTTSYGQNSGTGGTGNSFFGNQAGNPTTGDYNVFLGFHAGRNSTIGTRNIFVGSFSGRATTSGASNIFIGYASGLDNTTGFGNIYIGEHAGQIGTTARFNSFIGHQSGKSITSGHSNSFTGYESGTATKSGMYNTFSGMRAGYLNTGSFNTFFGAHAGYNNTTANANMFIGFESGKNTTTGKQNTYVGTQSGRNNVIGTRNTFLGWQSGYNATGNNNVFLGYQAGQNEMGNNKLYIDNSPTGAPLVYGEFNTNQLGINTNTIPTGYTLAVNGKIISEELKVRTYATWPDYVFEKGYELKSLSQIETYIRKNGHLPNVPSAKEVTENGFKVGEINATLLEKVEELTLYAIAQQKQIVQQQSELKELKALVNTLLEKK